MSRMKGKAGAFGSGNAITGVNRNASSFGGFSSTSSGSGLSYLTEPPDFSSISDANVGVSFKNLLKKDATTKTKALEELVASVQASPHDKDGGAEEAVLEAWVQIYPRTSIDNARRVRELSHTLQYELMKSARKRMEKRVPRIVGSWLAGVYDKDRGVSRAANDGLSSFLNNPDKVAQFWLKCQSQILAYATDAIQETKDTLSDERSTTPDDAEAKYLRVIGSSLYLVLGLLQKLDQSDLDTEAAAYDSFFDEDKVWKSANSGDSAVEKASCQLLWVCLDKRPESVPGQISRLKKTYITEGLRRSHMGSAVEFIRVLSRLTNKYPEIWSSSSGDKKTPISRLCGFLERGSQATSVKYWEYLEHFIAFLPREHITLYSGSEILKSLRVGIAGRDEPRIHAPTAWTCYVRTARHLISLLPEDSPRDQFVRDHLFPLTDQYLHPCPENVGWDLGGSGKLNVLVEAFNVCTDRHHEDVIQATAEEWKRLSSEFTSRISNSLPEVSSDYEKSQQAVADEGSRWFALVGQLHAKTSANHQRGLQIVQDASRDVVQCALQLLANRNLKPFGAAVLLHHASNSACHMWEDDAASSELETFLLEQGYDRMELLVESRSAHHLFSCISSLGDAPTLKKVYARVWKVWMDSLLGLSDNSGALDGVKNLAAHEAAASLAVSHERLQELIALKASQSIQGTTDAWGFVEAIVANDAVVESTSERIVQDALAILRIGKQHSVDGLRALEIIAHSNPGLLSQDETMHMSLITALLGLMELEDGSISSRASTLRALIDNRSSGKPAVAAIVQRNLEDAGPQSLGIETLYQQAKQAIELDAVGTADIFPNTNIWMEQLQVFLQKPVHHSLSVTSKVGGALFLVQPSRSDDRRQIRRDRDGCSIPARMALYTTKLLSSQSDLESLPQEFQVEILFLLYVTIQLVSDQITLMEQHLLWASLSYKDALTVAEELVSNTRGVVQSLVDRTAGWGLGTDGSSADLAESLTNMMVQQSKELTPLGLYSSRGLLELVEAMTERHGMVPVGDEKLAQLDVLKASPTTVLAGVALLNGFGEALQSSKMVNNVCNRLVSDTAGLTIQSEKALATLVLLNACLQVYDGSDVPVANNRLVFAIRQITSWLDDPVGLTPALSAEVCRALQGLLPSIKDVYGPHWERAIEFCTMLWTRAADDDLDEAIPYIHASLKLMRTLESLEEPNDDLEDALKQAAQTKSLALIELLKLPRERSTQPLEIVDGMICRQIEKLPLKHVTDLSDLYGLVASESRDIQTAAFSLLHRALPASQEQLSIDVLLEKKDARLPDELLSLLLDAPTLEKYPDEELAQFPIGIRSYLLSWCLIFDAYSAASLKVRTDFTEHLKTENYVGPLMDFVFDVLGHSAAHPLNLDREGFKEDRIKSYDLKVADSEPEEHNMHWLIIHIFYLCLKYTPGLFKSWHIECRSKQTKNAVSTWMTKYFTPIIVAEILDDVTKWAKTQEDSGDDDQELIVKVSPVAKEITAGYEVDDSLASMAIRVPPGYPLENVSVYSVNRVAVDERKWQSWLMTTQGVITFSNGSIIDGLSTFRRNIVGALKGQSECAICYSIISTDKRMPDKKCTTCKNLFHRVCLYKWFQSSNQNTCPLCRNPIDYLGADVKARRAAV